MKLLMKILALRLATCERTRSWAVWHDHATIAGKGYILVTCNVVYDSAVFKRDDEIQQGSETNMQTYIEEPKIHIIALLSSSLEDQTALLVTGLNVSKNLLHKLHPKLASQSQTNCSFSLETSQQRSLSVALNRVATTSVDLVGVGNKNG